MKNTENGTRGRFACMAVSIDLSKHLNSKIRNEISIQRVEYEALPTIGFKCGRYGYLREVSPLELVPIRTRHLTKWRSKRLLVS